MDFILQFADVVYYIDSSADIKESLHSWDEVYLVMMYDLFNMLSDSARILLRIFASMLISDISL